MVQTYLPNGIFVASGSVIRSRLLQNPEVEAGASAESLQRQITKWRRQLCK